MRKLRLSGKLYRWAKNPTTSSFLKSNGRCDLALGACLLGLGCCNTQGGLHAAILHGSSLITAGAGLFESTLEAYPRDIHIPLSSREVCSLGVA